MGLATRTQISVCKLPFPSAGTAVSLFGTLRVPVRDTYHTHMISVEKIYSVGTINNVETSYITQVLPNDNVSMSVGHLDHVLIVYTCGTR